MKPNFLLIHGEAPNHNHDALCHLILCPVVAGEAQPTIEYILNPEAKFYFVNSGITFDQVNAAPKVADKWPEIEQIISMFDCVVCSADGNVIHTLYGTLTRLGINFKSFRYCNAKALCRKFVRLVSYNFDFLNFWFFKDYIEDDKPLEIAQRWAQFANMALKDRTELSILDALCEMGITPGLVAPNDFCRQEVKRDYSLRYRERKIINPETVVVNARPNNPFFQMNVVFTGKLEAFTRNQARTEVVKIGGLAPESLTKDTDYLVVGKQDLRIVGEKGLSGKMKKAEKFCSQGVPIEIINETDFLEMLSVR